MVSGRGVGGGFFFFQAEDGIRVHCVTGIQTCALPVYYLGGLTLCHGPQCIQGKHCKGSWIQG